MRATIQKLPVTFHGDDEQTMSNRRGHPVTLFFFDPKFGLVLALLLAGSMWFYVQHVLIAHQRADAALHGLPRGNLSDLYPRWLGAKELLLHDRDPYSAEVTREIQSGYYARPLDPA